MPGLYLHIPFCEKKCIYCDFYSIESLNSMEDFLHSLTLEIERYRSFYQDGQTFETIYFGGGTPSLLSPATLASILEELQNTFSISSAAEITLETNPGTVDLRKLRGFREVGVNRLSVGIQSFHPEELRILSRIHSAEEAKECVRLAHRAGFENVSIDLIFALPNQTLQAWKENLCEALSLGPKHISAYSLIVEDGTPLQRMVERGEVQPADEQLESEMYSFTMEYLAAHGYQHYEVSNYALPGFYSRHNSLYWSHKNYLGLGPSAHSFWMGIPLEKPTRWWNFSSVGRYCEMLSRGKSPVEGREELERRDLLVEEIFLSLRSGGINTHEVRQLYGINIFDRHPKKFESYLREELITIDRDIVRLTPRGFLLCDGIALDLAT